MEDIKKVALPYGAVDANAWPDVQARQEEDLVRAYKLLASLIDELRLAGGDPAMFDELATLLDPSNFEIGSKIREKKLHVIYLKVISLPARVKAFKNLIDMLVTLNRMESQLASANMSNSAVDRINECLARIGQKVRKDLDSIAKPVRTAE